MTDYFAVQLPPEQIRSIRSIGLAHIGDAVYELLVRTWLCAGGKATGKGMHRAAVALVCAPRQAELAEKILPLLTQEEQDVFRRGRNANVHSIPAHASRAQYQQATALEALLDYGRPRAVELLVLIDRGHRELPIHADYVGRAVNTSRHEHVDVLLEERDGEDAVRLGDSQSI